MPTDAKMKEAIENLKKVDNKVDYNSCCSRRNYVYLSSESSGGDNITKKLFRRMVSCNKFLYEPGRLKESIDGLLNIMRSDSVVSLNCNDLLRLASESELLCQGTEGIKEVVLFDAVVKWKTSKSLRSCLVNIVGDITLADVSEICSLIQTYSDDSLLVGCRYEEKETINVFSLWKLMKKE